MATTYTKNKKTYFRSEDVKVFPCAYRGFKHNYDSDNNITGPSLPFDPEARGFTERNFSNIYSKAGKSKESFIIS